MNINEDCNLSMFLLLPLISVDDITAEDIIGGYEDALMNSFSYDINKPYLDDHIHLVFDNSMFKEKDVEPITKRDELCYISHYRLSGVYVKVYALKISDEFELSKRLIMNNDISSLMPEVKAKIFKFWNTSGRTNLFDILYNEKPSDKEVSKEILPEEDYIETETIEYVTNFSLRSDWDY
jgi:hypothetical protein